MRRGFLKDLRAAFDKARGASDDTEQDADLLNLQREVIATIRHLEGEILRLEASLDIQSRRIEILDRVRLAALDTALKTKTQNPYPYAYSLGERVEVIDQGPGRYDSWGRATVEAISRSYYDKEVTYGLSFEHRGGLYYFKADRLKSAP